MRRLLLAGALALFCGCHQQAPREPTHVSSWVATWAPAQQLVEPRNMPPAPLSGSTLRQVARVTLGGNRVRVRISNAFGDGPVDLSSVHIARAAGRGIIAGGTDRALTFHGKPSVSIAPGATATSDEIEYDVAPLSDVALTMQVEHAPGKLTGHPGSRATSWLQSGGLAAAPEMADARPTEHWYLWSAIDVVRADDAAVIAVLGNSITDGRGSGTDRNTRWTDVLAKRLQASNATARIGVINAGLGGNAVLRGGLGPPMLERLDRDVFDQPGVRWLIVLAGVNDIGTSTSRDTVAVAGELIAALEQIARRAHARSVRVYGSTILPFGGSQYDSREHEAVRGMVNRWIRKSPAYDVVIDFDVVMRDPANPARLRAAFDTGDHLHPNEAGYQAMGEAVGLVLFWR